MHKRILSGMLVVVGCAAGAGVAPGTMARVWAAPAAGATPATAPPAAAPPASPPGTTFPGGELGELLATYVPREAGDLQRLIADARVVQRVAGSEIDGAKRLAVDADGRVRIVRGEMIATRTRRDVARRSGDLAKRTEAEAAYRRQMRELAYLERLRDTMTEDAERAAADQAAAAARLKALELELQLARMNADLRQPNVSLLAISRYRDALWNALEAQRLAAERSREASGRQSRVAELRMRQVYSLSQLGR
jgi:hypothetical protein